MRSKTLSLIIGSISSLVLTAGPGYAEDGTLPSTPDPSAVRYAVPADHPEGSISLLSFGVESVTTSPVVKRDYLHVRMVAENLSGHSPWKMYAAEQGLQEGSQWLQPVYAESSTDKASLTVDPGNKGWLDLFFSVDRQTAPASLLVDWMIDIGGRLEQQTTAFDRESGAASVYYGPETSLDSQFVPVGPNWWYSSEPWVNASIDADLSLTHLYRIVQLRHIRLPPLVIHASRATEAAGKGCPGC